ncbi:MAG: endo-1,4-beta-xylanase, partial [Lentisphaeria bacterium]|nr:endo-1,4-beta-xylanase [Lentisphaeria bacterium]
MGRGKELLKKFEEQKLFMNDRISSGIEANRKGYAFLSITGADGKNVPVDEIKIIQKDHDFRYGANLFMLEEFPHKEQNEEYKALFPQIANIATLPFYWDALEPEPGKVRFEKTSPRIYRRPPPDLCLEYCKEKAIEPKAHCLNYAPFSPEWARGSVQWEKKCLEKRFALLAERYREKIPMWEVTNETYWQYFKKSSFYMAPDFVEWSFALAENYFPANKLIINEAHPLWLSDKYIWNRSPYYMQIERAMLKGARIDSVGMQFHMFYRKEQELEMTRPFYDPERLYNIMDTYAMLGKPMQITEMTIPAYSDNEEDQEIQAAILKNLYQIFFSHPAMEAVIYWNLVDGFAAYCEPGDMQSGENYYYGGLIQYDFTPKKAFYAIKDMFEKEYRTFLVTTAPEGTLSFKGFYGN